MNNRTLIIIVVLLILFGGGPYLYAGDRYSGPYLGGSLLTIVLVLILLRILGVI